MAQYIDSFVIPVPKKSLKAYKSFAARSGKLWLKHGALSYVECLADDVSKGKSTSFPRSVKLKSGETVVFAYVTYKSRAHRNKVHSKLMKDSAAQKMWDEMPFDGMRMIFGGFKPIVSL